MLYRAGHSGPSGQGAGGRRRVSAAASAAAAAAAAFSVEALVVAVAVMLAPAMGVTAVCLENVSCLVRRARKSARYFFFIDEVPACFLLLSRARRRAKRRRRCNSSEQNRTSAAVYMNMNRNRPRETIRPDSRATLARGFSRRARRGRRYRRRSSNERGAAGQPRRARSNSNSKPLEHSTPCGVQPGCARTGGGER